MSNFDLTFGKVYICAKDGLLLICKLEINLELTLRPSCRNPDAPLDLQKHFFIPQDPVQILQPFQISPSFEVVFE